MRPTLRFAVPALALASIAGVAAAQHAGSAVRARFDSLGTSIVPAYGPGPRLPAPAGTDVDLWTFVEPVSIPESCGLSQSSGHAWVGQHLNNERLQLFAIQGNGVPLNEFLGGPSNSNPTVVAVAMNADFAAFCDQQLTNGPLQVKAYRSTSTQPLWTFDVPELYTGIGPRNLRVSRDGSRVVMAVVNPNGGATAVIALKAADGTVINQWLGVSGGCSGLEITDDGTRAIICEGSPPAGIGRLLNTSTGTEITTFPGNGAGGWFNISGNGDVIVIGGFNFRVFVWNGTAYQLRINFSAPTSWFSWGAAVSRDGSTVGALSHNYGTSYLNTDVRMWDVESGALLGAIPTVGTGQYQDSAWGGVMSDDGSRFAVASWGDQGNSHAEVRVFDRQLKLVDFIDTPGSPFSLDMTGDGQYLIVGYKSVHANIFGSGGGVRMIKMPLSASCYANCDGSTVAPALNVADFICFQNQFAAGNSYANCDGSTVPPTLNVADFICFLNAFGAGCS
ncbi:MAG: GC-type dockerin domain-anchored protein [Phycisphaerales bacterium]